MKSGSSIVFIASYAAYNPSEFLGAYSVSKTALVGLTKVLAKDVGAKGIRVNCVAPGIIQTAFSEALWKNEAAAERLNGLSREGVAPGVAGVLIQLFRFGMCRDSAEAIWHSHGLCRAGRFLGVRRRV
jgi:dehydrogenase/reductase SDR family protein 4